MKISKYLASLGFILLCAGCVSPGSSGQAQPQEKVQTEKLLPSRADKVAVTLYEMRSAVPEINIRGATDMFKTALVSSGRFRVVERIRLNEGAMREKQLNGSGQTSGKSAEKQLLGAEYVFEASFSETSTGESQDQGGINVGGLQLGGSRVSETVAIDVRIVDVGTGEVIDAISVRRSLKSSNKAMSGVSALAQTIASAKGIVLNPFLPDVTVQSARKDSVDKVLRELIDRSVERLGTRFEKRVN
jgi:curli biogenesis system outer membrane secretion channel CsgG